MGEVRDSDEESAQSAWSDLLENAERSAHLGFTPHAEQLRAGGPPPGPSEPSPIVIDTDVGGDPDDALALVAAAHEPNLALVVTSDEHRGTRARFARHLLDQLGRSDVPIVAGADLGNSKYFCVGDLVPPSVGPQSTNLVAAMDDLCVVTPGQVRWVGIGPMTNLARLIQRRPELISRLTITQMGGAINYRDPKRAEHNFRLDPAAVHTVLANAPHLRLVTSDVSFNPHNAVTRDSVIYRDLCDATDRPWASTLRQHMDHWFDSFHPATMQHDALTLSVALELPFVTLLLDEIHIGDDARMTLTPQGHRLFLSASADYPAFMRWLRNRLAVDPATREVTERGNSGTPRPSL